MPVGAQILGATHGVRQGFEHDSSPASTSVSDGRRNVNVGAPLAAIWPT